MKIPSRWIEAGLLAIPGVLLGDPATDPAATMPPTVVTATRSAEPPGRAAYAVSRVDAEEMGRRQLRILPEALREEPSVMVQKTGNAQASPYLRGFTGFRTLLLVDGIRLNNSVFRDGPNQYWNTVDPWGVDRLELVRGPGSVLYGSDAVGGTVNALTLDRPPGGGEFTWDGRTAYRWSSAEDSHVGRVEFAADEGDWGGRVGATVKEFGDLRGGAEVGRQPRTGYAERDVDARFTWRVQPGLDLVFAHQSVDQDDAWRTHSTVHGSTWAGVRPGSNRERILDQDRNLTYVQLHGRGTTPWVDAFHFNLSHQRQAEDEWRVRSNRSREEQGFEVNTLGTWVTLESPSPVGRWVYGLEYYRDWVESGARRWAADGTPAAPEIQGPVGDDAGYDLAGVFAEDRIPVGERVEFTVGGRYTRAAAAAGAVRDPRTGGRTSVERAWDSLVGNFRGRVALDEAARWQVFGGVSQAFRAPNLSDLTRFDIAESGQMETAAPDLDPEHFVSLEGGLRAGAGRFEGEVAYYRTLIRDQIVRTPTGAWVGGLAEVTKKNSGEGFIHGVEVSGRVRLHRDLALRGMFTWMEGELEAYPNSAPVRVTEPVSRLMPMTGLAALRWESPGRQWWTEFLVTLAARQDRLPAQDRRDIERIPPGGTPGYDVYSLRGGWRPCRQFGVTLAAENLGDADYRIHGSGINEAGRNFLVTADLRF
ncbi:MAG: TonB-dependent receptor plug domain-containing protein [Verrucomicrobiota bacterium]